jgi:hypothetical protein
MVSSTIYSILPSCTVLPAAYVASQTFSPSGNDSNSCNQTTPCLTISQAITSFGNVQIRVLECTYVSLPVTIPANNGAVTTLQITVATTSSATVASLGWNTSYSGLLALFNLNSNGKIVVKNITIIHNINSKNSIFSATGNSSLRLDGLTVKGGNSTGSITSAAYPFIVLTGGAAFLSRKVVYVNMSFSGSNGSIVYANNSADMTFMNDGSVSYIFNEATEFDGGLLTLAPWTMVSSIKLYINLLIVNSLSATAANGGGLIRIINTDQSVFISGMSVTGVNVSQTTTLGGVIYINSALAISILKSNFIGVKAKQGGVIYINNCSNIKVSSCSFLNVESVNGPGGAIFFGTGADFVVEETSFQLCKSTGGAGGAIACNSTSTIGLRSIKLSNFTNNVGGAENKGNDFADITSTVTNMLCYTVNSISQIRSTSSTIKFYYSYSDISLDCLLDGSCQVSTIYVNGGGSDHIMCGNNAAAGCLSVDYAFTNRLILNSTMYIANGTFPVSSRDINIAAPFLKAFEGYGFEIDDVSAYPTLYPSNSSNWIRITNNPSYRQVITFQKLRFLHTTNFSSYMFSISQTSHLITFQYCYFTKESPNTLVPNNILQIDYGIFYLFILLFYFFFFIFIYFMLF